MEQVLRDALARRVVQCEVLFDAAVGDLPLVDLVIEVDRSWELLAPGGPDPRGPLVVSLPVRNTGAPRRPRRTRHPDWVPAPPYKPTWGEPRVALDPLAVLLRSRYRSRAALARATRLGYESLRTWTDGLWRARHSPPDDVLEALAGRQACLSRSAPATSGLAAL